MAPAAGSRGARIGVGGVGEIAKARRQGGVGRFRGTTGMCIEITKHQAGRIGGEGRAQVLVEGRHMKVRARWGGVQEVNSEDRGEVRMTEGAAEELVFRVREEGGGLLGKGKSRVLGKKEHAATERGVV